MPPLVTTIFDAAVVIKNTVIDIYADNSVSLPARRLVAEGAVAWDCEQLAIEFRRNFRGIPGIEDLSPDNCAGVRAAEFHVWVIRCASPMKEDGSPPSVTAMETVAEAMMTDAWLLPWGLQDRIGSGEIPTLACEEVIVGPLVPQGPEGGYVGVDLTLFWQVVPQSV